MRIKTRAIPDPGPQPSRSVILPTQLPFVRGDGDVDLVCAGCELVVAQDIRWGQISDIVIRCPGCGTFSDLTQLQ